MSYVYGCTPSCTCTCTVPAVLLAWTAPTCIDPGPDDGLLQLALVVIFLVALVHILSRIGTYYNLHCSYARGNDDELLRMDHLIQIQSWSNMD